MSLCTAVCLCARWKVRMPEAQRGGGASVVPAWCMTGWRGFCLLPGAGSWLADFARTCGHCDFAAVKTRLPGFDAAQEAVPLCPRHICQSVCFVYSGSGHLAGRGGLKGPGRVRYPSVLVAPSLARGGQRQRTSGSGGPRSRLNAPGLGWGWGGRNVCLLLHFTLSVFLVPGSVLLPFLPRQVGEGAEVFLLSYPSNSLQPASPGFTPAPNTRHVAVCGCRTVSERAASTKRTPRDRSAKRQHFASPCGLRS